MLELRRGRIGATAAAATASLGLVIALVASPIRPAAAVTPDPPRFELTQFAVGPNHPYFDARRRVNLRWRYRGEPGVDVEISLIRKASGNVVGRWEQSGLEPGTDYVRRWDGLSRRRGSVDDGAYTFRIRAVGRERMWPAGSFVWHGHIFPVDGPHSDRGAIGVFGAPRSGGRTHEGYDIVGDCGTRLRAARGGVIATEGFDPELNGWYLLINARLSSKGYFYAHMRERSPFREGDRIHTGDFVGEIGQTGNAAGTPCHLHFEVRRSGVPIDPYPFISRWDRWS